MGDHNGEVYVGVMNIVRTRSRNSWEANGTAAKPANTLQRGSVFTCQSAPADNAEQAIPQSDPAPIIPRNRFYKAKSNSADEDPRDDGEYRENRDRNPGEDGDPPFAEPGALRRFRRPLDPAAVRLMQSYQARPGFTLFLFLQQRYILKEVLPASVEGCADRPEGVRKRIQFHSAPAAPLCAAPVDPPAGRAGNGQSFAALQACGSSGFVDTAAPRAKSEGSGQGSTAIDAANLAPEIRRIGRLAIRTDQFQGIRHWIIPEGIVPFFPDAQCRI